MSEAYLYQREWLLDRSAVIGEISRSVCKIVSYLHREIHLLHNCELFEARIISIACDITLARRTRAGRKLDVLDSIS